MTRRDYIALARALRAARPEPLTGTSAIAAMAAGIPEGEAFDRAAYEPWEAVTYGICRVLMSNRAFDATRFLKACGMTDVTSEIVDEVRQGLTNS